MDITNTPNPIKLSSFCTVYGNFGAASRHSAVITWYSDDRIGVYLYDIATKQYTAKVIEAHLHELSNVMVTLSILSFQVNKRVYEVDFDPNAYLALMGSTAASVGLSIATNNTLAPTVAGGAGGLFAEHMSKNSSTDEWINTLRAAKITVDTAIRQPASMGLKWGLIIGFAFILLVLGGSFVAAAINTN